MEMEHVIAAQQIEGKHTFCSILCVCCTVQCSFGRDLRSSEDAQMQLDMSCIHMQITWRSSLLIGWKDRDGWWHLLRSLSDRLTENRVACTLIKRR